MQCESELLGPVIVVIAGLVVCCVSYWFRIEV